MGMGIRGAYITDQAGGQNNFEGIVSRQTLLQFEDPILPNAKIFIFAKKRRGISDMNSSLASRTGIEPV